MSQVNPTEDEYLAWIDDTMQQGAYDYVASFEEWRRFKAALQRWVDQQEREWDSTAEDQEHEA